jgi:hypothetical protein
MQLEEGVEGCGASLLGSDHQKVGQAVTALLLRPRMDIREMEYSPRKEG